MSWLFSRALVEEYSGESFSGGEPSALLNVMHTPHPFLLSDKTMAFSTPSQFGQTSRLLTDEHGSTVLMSFLAGSRARTSLRRARVQESRARDPASGWKWPASFAKYDPDSRSWRTRQCSLLEGLAVYSETWPRWGSMLDGECSVQPMPALRTFENGSGLLPTPRSTDGDRGGRGDLLQAVRGNPNSHYRMWQTPVADDAVDRTRGKVNSRGEPKLSAQVKQWPTPHGFSKDGKSNGPSGNELGRAVNREQWATPTVNGNYNRKGASEKAGDGLATQVGGSLNPPWVEWLMGWILGWTDLKPLEMDKYRQWLRSHGAS